MKLTPWVHPLYRWCPAHTCTLIALPCLAALPFQVEHTSQHLCFKTGASTVRVVWFCVFGAQGCSGRSQIPNLVLDRYIAACCDSPPKCLCVTSCVPVVTLLMHSVSLGVILFVSRHLRGAPSSFQESTRAGRLNRGLSFVTFGALCLCVLMCCMR